MIGIPNYHNFLSLFCLVLLLFNISLQIRRDKDFTGMICLQLEEQGRLAKRVFSDSADTRQGQRR